MILKMRVPPIGMPLWVLLLALVAVSLIYITFSSRTSGSTEVSLTNSELCAEMSGNAVETYCPGR